MPNTLLTIHERKKRIESPALDLTQLVLLSFDLMASSGCNTARGLAQVAEQITVMVMDSRLSLTGHLPSNFQDVKQPLSK
jgi:hypothetical protein